MKNSEKERENRYHRLVHRHDKQETSEDARARMMARNADFKSRKNEYVRKYGRVNDNYNYGKPNPYGDDPQIEYSGGYGND